MTVQAQITINGSINQVWSVITNISNAATIISGIEKVELLNEPASGLLGLKWRETRLYFGKPAAIDKGIIEVVENNYYKTKAELDGFIFLTTLAITTNSSQVILTSTHETQAQGIMAKIKSLPMLFFKGILKKAILQDLTDYKNAIEQG